MRVVLFLPPLLLLSSLGVWSLPVPIAVRSVQNFKYAIPAPQNLDTDGLYTDLNGVFAAIDRDSSDNLYYATGIADATRTGYTFMGVNYTTTPASTGLDGFLLKTSDSGTVLARLTGRIKNPVPHGKIGVAPISISVEKTSATRVVALGMWCNGREAVFNESLMLVQNDTHINPVNSLYACASYIQVLDSNLHVQAAWSISALHAPVVMQDNSVISGMVPRILFVDWLRDRIYAVIEPWESTARVFASQPFTTNSASYPLPTPSAVINQLTAVAHAITVFTPNGSFVGASQFSTPPAGAFFLTSLAVDSTGLLYAFAFFSGYGVPFYIAGLGGATVEAFGGSGTQNPILIGFNSTACANGLLPAVWAYVFDDASSSSYDTSGHIDISMVGGVEYMHLTFDLFTNAPDAFNSVSFFGGVTHRIDNVCGTVAADPPNRAIDVLFGYSYQFFVGGFVLKMPIIADSNTAPVGDPWFVHHCHGDQTDNTMLYKSGELTLAGNGDVYATFVTGPYYAASWIFGLYNGEYHSQVVPATRAGDAILMRISKSFDRVIWGYGASINTTRPVDGTGLPLVPAGFMYLMYGRTLLSNAATGQVTWVVFRSNVVAVPGTSFTGPSVFPYLYDATLANYSLALGQTTFDFSAQTANTLFMSVVQINDACGVSSDP